MIVTMGGRGDKRLRSVAGGLQIYFRLILKGALNPNFLNLTTNREKFCL